MKKIAVFLAVIMLLVLIIVPTFAAQSGVQGQLWDSKIPAASWAHGAIIYATNCDAGGSLIGDEVYVAINLAAGTSSFSADWLTNTAGYVGTMATPSLGDRVCLYVQWNDGGINTPAVTITTPITYVSFPTGRMSFGNIHSGTGPTAVTLQDFGTTASNLPLLGIGLVVLLLVSVTFITIRRRQNA